MIGLDCELIEYMLVLASLIHAISLLIYDF